MLFVVFPLLAGLVSAQVNHFDSQVGGTWPNQQHHSNFNTQPGGTWQQQSPPQHHQRSEECLNGPRFRSVPEIPREYLQAHNRFTSDLLKHPGFWANIHQNGVSSTNSFTLGHLLTVLSQETFDVPTTNIARILRVSSTQDAVNSYSQQFYNFEEEDNHVYPTSYLFTPYDNLPAVTPGIERLFTRKWISGLWKNPQASNQINELVRVATRDYIQDELVPQVPPFVEQTAGVFTTTFHFANDWKHEWAKIGKQTFNTPNGPVSIHNYEFNGAFPVLETQGYTAVAVPLEGDIKYVVYVLPTGDLKDYFSQGVVDEIFTSGPDSWPKKNVRVQVPHVNVTVAHGFSQLQEERVECTVEGGVKSHVIHPIVQVVTFALNHEEVVYSVANGVQVNQGGHSSSYRHLNQANRPFQTSPPVVPYKPVPNRINTSYNQNQYKYTSAELVFDRPFFVYLHDKGQGPFGFTAISSNFHEGQKEAQRQLRHHDSPFDFTENTKLHRWTCQ